MKHSKYYIVIALILLTIFSSCKKDKTSYGSSATRPVAEFSVIDYRLPGNLIVQNGDHYQVDILTKSDLIKIKTEVTNGKLVIYADENISNANDITYIVTTPKFQKLQVANSGIASLKYNFDPNTNLELEVSGSGSIEAQTPIQVEKVTGAVSGSGNIKLSGETNTLNANVTGSGSINAFSLNTKKAKANVSGSGNIECNVFSSLDATISGSGNISYKGNPGVYSTIAGSGKIVHVD